MSATERFRKQHDDLLKWATDLSGMLNPQALSADASTAREVLSKLLGTLSIHLAMEDKSLYPRLIDSEDLKIKTTAKAYQDEMGGIAQVVDGYKHAWPTAQSIQQDAEKFATETKGIISALDQRIHKENEGLYKMVDELG